MCDVRMCEFEFEFEFEVTRDHQSPVLFGRLATSTVSHLAPLVIYSPQQRLTHSVRFFTCRSRSRFLGNTPPLKAIALRPPRMPRPSTTTHSALPIRLPGSAAAPTKHISPHPRKKTRGLWPRPHLRTYHPTHFPLAAYASQAHPRSTAQLSRSVATKESPHPRKQSRGLPRLRTYPASYSPPTPAAPSKPIPDPLPASRFRRRCSHQSPHPRKNRAATSAPTPQPTRHLCPSAVSTRFRRRSCHQSSHPRKQSRPSAAPPPSHLPHFPLPTRRLRQHQASAQSQQIPDPLPIPIPAPQLPRYHQIPHPLFPPNPPPAKKIAWPSATRPPPI